MVEKQLKKLIEELGITGHHSDYSNEIKAIALHNISKEFKRFNDLFEKYIDIESPEPIPEGFTMDIRKPKKES